MKVFPLDESFKDYKIYDAENHQVFGIIWYDTQTTEMEIFLHRESFLPGAIDKTIPPYLMEEDTTSGGIRPVKVKIKVPGSYAKDPAGKRI